MTATIGLTLVGTVTPAEASPAEVARRTAAATLAEVRSAAAAQDARVKAETEAPAAAATGTIEAGKPVTVEAADLGASVSFSGNKIDSTLQVSIGSAPAVALRAARSEQPGHGIPVSDPVQISAKESAGGEVTQFPAKLINTRGGGDKGPVVSDVVPGVSLQLKPDMSLVTANDLDPKTLQIYTRENPGDPWSVLPSYYDAKAGVVKGESTHLSQFVVIGTPFPVPAGPVVVLDPDNDEGHASTPAPSVTELPYNLQLAQAVADMITNDCAGTAYLTRGSADPVSRETRAGFINAHSPDLTIGIGFNTWEGVAWGGEHPEQGGSQVYSRGGAADDEVSNSLVETLPTYTGRPAKNMGNNGNFPGDEFGSTPNAFTHLEALFLDNNYDRAFIDNGGMPHLADGVFTALGKYLQNHGFNCVDPVTGGWPTPPSAAQLAQWRMLGFQNYLTYGGEPFSFSTGNLVEQEKLFSLPGQGGSGTDLSLVYNSRDGRLNNVGAGWSFSQGSRAQRFIDGSVLVVRGDGASYMFSPDGHGGYLTDPTLHQTLTEAGGGKLKLTDVSSESWVFDASNIDGIGNLISHTDSSGHTTTFSWGAASDPKTSQFYPLTAITDSAGQTIHVQDDALGRIIGFTRPGGDHWSLGYDGAGNLTTVTLPDGRTHQFTYDQNHQLLTGTDATGATYLKNQYDGAGRVVHQWDVQGNERSLDYSVAGQTAYTDNVGRKSTYFFDSASRITKVKHPDGTTATFSYDSQNNVTSSTDENGAKTRYVYDSAGNLTKETGPDGVVAKYTYTPTGQLATKTDTGAAQRSNGGPATRTWSYDYDREGHVTTIHQPDGTTITNSYDSSGNLVKSVQPSGAATTYGHDAAGNVTSSTDPDGRTTSYAYDAAGRMVSQTSPSGHKTTYAWDSGDQVVTMTNPAGGLTAYGWEPNDHLASLTDPTGAVTKYTWDAMFHLTSSTSPTGGVTTYAYTAEDALAKTTDPLGAVTANTVDEQNRVVKTIDPNGGTWTYAYDGVGNLIATTSPSGARTANTYDASGNLTSTTDPTGGRTRYVYDSVGRLVKQTDPDGVTTAYTYDVLDRVTRITDGLGKHTVLAYDVDGNLTSVVDRQGNPWTYGYDPAGQLLTAKTPLGETTRYGYDVDGNVVATTDPLGRTTTSSYDALGRVIVTADPAGNTTAYAYDADGRTVAVTDPNGHTVDYAYDPGGNQTSMTDPTGAVTRYGWDAAGNQTSMTSPQGTQTEYKYDAAAQLIGVTEGAKAGRATGSDVNVRSTYGYDKDGNLTSTTDPNGHTTTYAVDKAGRTVREVNAVGNATSWEYTAAGRLAKAVTGTGATTTYAYDRRGDVVRQDQAGRIATYEYGSDQQLIAMTDPTGVSGWKYDKDGRTTTQIDQQGGRLTTSYDKASEVTGMSLPTGERIAYTYDQSGNVTSQSSPWGSLTYGWDPAGNLAGITRSSGLSTSYTYDADDRVASILHQTPRPAASTAAPAVASPSAVPYGNNAAATKCSSVAGYLGSRSTPAASESDLCKHTNTYLSGRTLPTPTAPVAAGGSIAYNYSYDPDGNVSSATRNITPPTRNATTAKPTTTSITYGYDRLDRLVSSVTGAGEKNAYSYDPAGNRTGWARSGAADGNFTQTATYNDANQLTQSSTSAPGRGVSAGIASYSYDGAGNRTAQSIGGVSTSFQYNPAGQATAIIQPGRTTTASYDGLGRQASSTDQTKYGTDTTRNAYNGTALTQASSSVHGTSTLIRDAAGALAEHVTQSGSATWDLLDGLGSTVAGADAGTIAQLASYDDWGNQDFATAGWSAPENYTGHAQDPTANQVTTYARTYDPATGTWTSPDSWRGLLRQPQSLARYQYVQDNPTTFVDPDGHRLSDPGAYPTKSTPISDPKYGGGYVHAGPNASPAPKAPAAQGAKPPAKPTPTGPNSKNVEQARHAQDTERDCLIFGVSGSA